MSSLLNLFTEESNFYHGKSTTLTPAFFAKQVFSVWESISNKKPVFLEAGSANGYFLKSVSKHCAKVISYEIAERKWKALLENVHFECPAEVYFEDVLSFESNFKNSLLKSDIIYCYSGAKVFEEIKTFLNKKSISRYGNDTGTKLLVHVAYKFHEFKLLSEVFLQENSRMKGLYLVAFTEQEWVAKESDGAYGKIMSGDFSRKFLKISTKKQLKLFLQGCENQCSKSPVATVKNNFEKLIMQLTEDKVAWPEDWPDRTKNFKLAAIGFYQY